MGLAQLTLTKQGTTKANNTKTGWNNKNQKKKKQNLLNNQIKKIILCNMSDKQQMINDIYFDRSGFGSRKTTHYDARKKISP